jgi:hypothetical protein
MKRGIVVAAAAFGAGLALLVGLRLEQAGLAVLVGVVCGVLAGLPMTLVLWWTLAREREARLRLEERRWESERPAAAAPPVFILNSGRGPEMLPSGNAPAYSAPRDFVIVGEEEPAAGARR